MPDRGREPEDIVLGPDGNIWFTERGVDKIGRVIAGRTRRSIDEFDLPTGFTRPVQHHGRARQQDLVHASNGSSAGRGRGSTRSNPADSVGQGGYGLSGSPRGDRGRARRQRSGVGEPAATSSSRDRSRDDGRGRRRRDFTRRLQPQEPRHGPGRERLGRRTSAAKIARVTTPSRDRSIAVRRPGGGDLRTSSPGPTATSGTRHRRATTRVGRITPAGVAGHAVPDEPTRATQLGITVGPDGALWFAQAVANDVGRDDDRRCSLTEVKRLDGRRAARVHRRRARQHALVHREGRQPDRADHGHRRRRRRAAAATAASAGHDRAGRDALPHHAQGVPGRRARHGDQVDAVGGRHGHDQLRAPREAAVGARCGGRCASSRPRGTRSSASAAAST